MATETNRSSRLFDPMVGSDVLFLDPSTGDSRAAEPQSTAGTSSASNSQASNSQASNQPEAQGETVGQIPNSSHAGQGNDTAGNGDGSAGSGDNGGDGAGSGAGDNGGGGPGGDGNGAGSGGNGAGNGGGGNGGGGSGDGSNFVDTVVQTVGAVGSSSLLNDIVNPSDLFGGPGGGLVNGISDTLGTNGLGDTASGLVNTVVSDVSQTAGAIGNGGSLDGILNAVGDGAGNLVDDVLGVVDGATGSGIVGGIVDGLGDNVVSGALGGAGLLSGTPLDGIQGDGALLGAGLLHADGSSSSNLIQVEGGTDTSQGLINVNAASDRSASESNHVVDTNIGPDSSGNGVTADMLGADRDSSGSLIDADASQHQGPSLVGINAGTAADQFQFPALDGTGLDSLVGEIGPLPGNPIGGGDLLPVSAGVDGHALIDIGADGTVDSGDTHINDGTQIMVNTPLQGTLV